MLQGLVLWSKSLPLLGPLIYFPHRPRHMRQKKNHPQECLSKLTHLVPARFRVHGLWLTAREPSPLF